MRHVLEDNGEKEWALSLELLMLEDSQDAARHFEQLLSYDRDMERLCCTSDVMARSGACVCYDGKDLEVTPLGFLIKAGGETSLMMMLAMFDVIGARQCLRPCALFVQNRGTPAEVLNFCFTPLGFAIQCRNLAAARLLLVCGQEWKKALCTEPCKFDADTERAIRYTPLAVAVDTRRLPEDVKRGEGHKMEVLGLLRYLLQADPCIRTERCFWKEVSVVGLSWNVHLLIDK